MKKLLLLLALLSSIYAEVIYDIRPSPTDTVKYDKQDVKLEIKPQRK